MQVTAKVTIGQSKMIMKSLFAPVEVGGLTKECFMFREMLQSDRQLSEKEIPALLEQGEYGTLAVLGDDDVHVAGVCVPGHPLRRADAAAHPWVGGTEAGRPVPRLPGDRTRRRPGCGSGRARPGRQPWRTAP